MVKCYTLFEKIKNKKPIKEISREKYPNKMSMENICTKEIYWKKFVATIDFSNLPPFPVEPRLQPSKPIVVD